MMRIFLCVFIAVAALSAAAAPARAQQTQRNCDEALNLEDADIREVVNEIALRTSRSILLDGRLNGRITIKSPPNSKLCADEAWELFQASLRVLGFTAVPVNGSKYQIVPVQEGPRSASPVDDGVAGDYVTKIVRLRHVDAREAAANLAQITSERGVVTAVRTGNSVILVDTVDNVARLETVLQQIDRDTSVYRTIALEYASATDVARVLNELAQEISEEGGGRSRPSVVAVEASNSVLVRAEPTMIDRMAAIVAELDQFGEQTSGIEHIYLRHGDAESIATILREVANSAGIAGGEPGAPGAGPRPGSGGDNDVTISFYAPTNSIIISGDADIQRRLRELVTQLDVRRAQVLVEAIIVEVSDTTARELGIQYFISGTEGSGVPFSTTNFASAQPNILAAAGALILDGRVSGGGGDDDDDGGVTSIGSAGGVLADAAISSLLGINGFALGGAAERNGKIFGAILTAIKQDDTSNVLSTPSVVTMDNQLATLSVGQEIPITTGEQIGDDFSNAFRTVSREQVGVILEVTPQINDGGTVTLEIRQETSSVAGPIIASSTDLITNNREIVTTAVVDDGDILVIGGLIERMEFDNQDKVPFLGDIPALGNLFKTTSRSRARQNLMVFIRPTILRDRDTSNAATQKKLEYIRARELLATGEPTSALEQLIDEVTGIDQPLAAPLEDAR